MSMPEPEEIDWKQVSQSFDTVADLYDAHRPVYPQELVDSAIALSGIPQGGRILEIGSGTGKATRLFAARGYAIHCIEPGGNMLAVAARSLQGDPRVTFEQARFEDWPEPAAEFDLVVSAQAFHWVPKEAGYPKAARALKPGGSLALIWNMSTGVDGTVGEEMDQVYHTIVPELGSPQTYNEETIRQVIADITDSGCFGPVTVKRFPWTQVYRTAEYLGLTNTYSDHLLLPDSKRQRLFAALAAVIDAHGGSLERQYVAVLYVAPKLA